MTSQRHDAGERPPAEPSASAEDLSIVEALRAGDEAAFVALVHQHHASLVRMAMVHVQSRAVAEEVAQETWLGVLRGLDRFEGRSSLKTWIFRIATNRAKTRGQREGRSIPFSSLGGGEADAAGPTVDPERFLPPGHQNANHWVSPPRDWEGSPEERLLSGEVRGYIQEAIRSLSPNQRQVITLRDIEGWDAQEVCNALEISETNQRVLLHRARARVRRALERYLDES